MAFKEPVRDWIPLPDALFQFASASPSSEEGTVEALAGLVSQFIAGSQSPSSPGPLKFIPGE